MTNKTRHLQLAFMMSVITLGITTLVLLHLYYVDLDQQKERLLEAVLLDANLIEAVTRYDEQQHQRLQLPGDSTEATLSQVREGLKNSKLLSQSERFYLIKETSEEIIISASNYELPSSMTHLSKRSPMARLFNQMTTDHSGTLIELDQYGKKVVAAYVKVPALNHILVAKIDVKELQEPFVFAAIISFFIAIILVITSSYQFLKYSLRMTNRLKEKEAKLRLLLEASGEAIYSIDLNGYCTFANPACVRILGFKDIDELLGQHMHRLIHHSHENGEKYPEDECHIYKSFLKDEKSHIDDEVFWKNDGSSLPVDYCSSPIKQDGELIGAVVSFTDASEKRMHERALKENEQRYRTAFEDAFVGIAHVSLEGRFIDINYRFCEIIGYNEEELKTLSFMDITHPDDLNKDLDKIENLLAGKYDHYTIEKRYFHKNGQTVWIELMVKLLKDLEGKPKKFISVINDITSRKESEQTLRKIQEAHNQAEQITHFGNWDWNIESGELYWTDEIYRIFGVEPQQFPATYEAFLKSIHPDDCSKVIEAVNSSVADKDHHYNVEHRVVRPSGEERYVQEQGRVYRNNVGEPIRMIGTVHDITDRKLAEIELESYKNKLEKLVDERTQALVNTQGELIKNERLATLGQVTATVSHELRNPLASIRSSLYVVEKLNHSEDPKLVNALQRVVRNVERCDHIIDELLDFTRSNTLTVTTTKIDEWLKELLEEQQLPEDIELELLMNCDECTADIDQGKFQRAIINIVENACQAMLEQPDKKHLLKIETSSSLDHISITISDNGPGIDDNDLPRIFEPLYSTKGFGTGLGLPTVKKIIDQHNGNISIDSHVGIGSNIMFYLPKYQENAVAI